MSIVGAVFAVLGAIVAALWFGRRRPGPVDTGLGNGGGVGAPPPQPPPPGPIPEPPPPLAQWDAYLAGPCAAHGIQPAYARRWIEIESAGQPCAVGDPRAGGDPGDPGADFPREIGIAQLWNPDDLRHLGATAAELRAYCIPGRNHPSRIRDAKGSLIDIVGFSQTLARSLTPAEMQRQADLAVGLIGLAMTGADRDLTAVAAGPGWARTQRDYWRLVKLQHALPGLSHSGLPAVAHLLGHAPRDWTELHGQARRGSP